jgi:hypothetical protein
MLLYPQSTNNDDLYIEILKYGNSNMDSPISYNQLKSHLDEIDIEYNDFTAMYLFTCSYFDVHEPTGNSFLILADSASFYSHIADSESFFLNTKGYSNLLSYNELREARSSSRQSLLIAVIAILFGPLAAILMQIKTGDSQSDTSNSLSSNSGNENETNDADTPEKQSYERDVIEENNVSHKSL